jgi:hypothetical protein
MEHLWSVKEEAWKKFLEKGPTNSDLRDVISRVLSLKDKAGQKLLEQNPSNDDLCFIMQHCDF